MARIARYRRRLGAQPGSRPGILLSACLAAAELDDPLLLLRFSENGLIRFPNVLQFRQLHAQALQATGQQQLALQAWAQLAKREPFNPQWWQAKAATLQQLEHSEQSRQQLAIAHALAPQDLTITEQYLIALIMAEHADQAVDVARNWLASQPTQTPANFTLLAAQAAYQAQDYASAEAWMPWPPSNAHKNGINGRSRSERACRQSAHASQSTASLNWAIRICACAFTPPTLPLK